MPARLVPLNPGSAPVVSLQRSVMLLGRHPECDVRLDFPAISRRHCCLALAYNRPVIRDLGSRHGVWVNGARIEEASLQPGDEVALGHLLYRYEDPDNNGKPPAPTPPSLPEPRKDPRDPDNDLLPISGAFPPF